MADVVKVHSLPSGAINQNVVTVSGPGVTLVDLNTTQTITGTKTFSGSVLTNATINTPTPYLRISTRAGAGTTISDANTITEASGTLILLTGGNNSVGVKLPVAVAGAHYYLKNDQAANGIMKLYPQVNSTINGLSSNTNIALAANTACMIVAYNTTNWMTFSLLPS